MELADFVKKWGDTTVKLMRYRIANTVNDSGFDKRDARILSLFNPEIIKDFDGIKWELELPEYAKWVDSGRGPGKMPPDEPIREWVSRKSITLQDITEDQFIFATRRLIALRGVKGTDFFEIYDKRINLLDVYIEEYIIKRVDDMLMRLKRKIEE